MKLNVSAKPSLKIAFSAKNIHLANHVPRLNYQIQRLSLNSNLLKHIDPRAASTVTRMNCTDVAEELSAKIKRFKSSPRLWVLWFSDLKSRNILHFIHEVVLHHPVYIISRLAS